MIDISILPKVLFEKLMEDPLDSIDTVQNVVKGLGYSKVNVEVKFEKFPRKLPVRSMKASRIGQFCAIEGIVRKISDIKPRVVVGKFKCDFCGTIVEVIQPDEHSFDIPYICPSCNTKVKWVFIPEKSILVDAQKFKIQEPPEGLDGGHTPATIDVEVYGDECDRITAGQRVVVNGWLKAWLPKPDIPNLSLFYKGNHVETQDSEYDEIVITDEDEEAIKQFSKRDDLLSSIVANVAPSVHGYGNVKRAIALQLFGGVTQSRKDGTRKRGDIHILLVGDPGIAKSQILKSVVKICPRGIMTSGKGSSTAGLTAAAVQDSQGGWTLEAGAVVLADKGQLLIDEIDKMTKDDRSALHQAMEQQEVSIAKAGITTTLQSRCSILAAANPKGGRYDFTLDMAEQVDLSPTLLSRFDLIFLLTDSPSESNDRAIATFVSDNKDSTLDLSFFRRYIAYCKRNIHPVLSPEAKEILIAYYTKVRGMAGRDKPMPLTMRQFEAMIRLAEASAKMKLSDEITRDDALLAVSVVDDCLKHIAYDAKTQSFDVDKMSEGLGKTRKDKRSSLMSVIRDVCKDNMGYAAYEVIKCRVPNVEKHDLDAMLEGMKQEGVLIEPRNGVYKPI
jgi:replicative DNA helicase Mcm